VINSGRWHPARRRLKIRNVGAECRHVMRPSVQLPSVYHYSGVLWRTSLYFLLFATTTATLITVEAFDVQWPWPLTFSTENRHSTYACPREWTLYQFWLYVFFFISELRARTGETERQTDMEDVMRPTGGRITKKHGAKSTGTTFCFRSKDMCNSTGKHDTSCVLFENIYKFKDKFTKISHTLFQCYININVN